MRWVGFKRGWIADVAACAVSQGFAASVPAQGYEGLDGFGRVVALRFERTGSPPAPQHESCTRMTRWTTRSIERSCSGRI